MAEAIRDENHVPSTLFESSTQPGLTLNGQIDEATGAILTSVVGVTGGTSGAGAPGTTPEYIGQVYVDTTGPDIYMAIGTSGPTDWVAIYTT